MKAWERRNKQNEKQAAALPNLAEEKEGKEGESQRACRTDNDIRAVSGEQEPMR